MGLTTSLCGVTDASSASSVVCIATPRPRTPSSLLPKGPDGARGRLDHPGDGAGVGDVMAWLALSTVTFDPARLAIHRASSGLSARSWVATMA